MEQVDSPGDSAVAPAGRWSRVGLWGLTLGVASSVALVVYYGADDVAAAVASAGSGIAVVVLCHLAQLMAESMGWQAVLAREGRPATGTFVWGRWLAESINDLLPVLQVGGNVVRAQVLANAGVAGATAGASVVVDMTLIMSTQVVFTVAGICLLPLYVDPGRVLGEVVAGLVLISGMLAGLLVVQRSGLLGRLASALERNFEAPGQRALVASAAGLDAEVRRLYQSRRMLIAASAWHLGGWLLGAAEVWVGLRFLGYPVTLPAAIMWESLGEVARTAAFVVPGAFGVQEGSYIVLGRLLGVPPEAALALSLIRRARELILGVPGVLAWRTHAAAGQLRRARARPFPEAE